MSVTDAEFKAWLGQVCSDNEQYVVNVNVVGRGRPNDLYVGRQPGGKVGYGNPFSVSNSGRFGAIRKYVVWLGQLTDDERIAYLTPIRKALASGKQLACYCAPLACHAHVLAGWAMALDWLVAETGVGTPEPERERSEPTISCKAERSEPTIPSRAEAAQPVGATATVTNAGPRFSSKR